jgi:RNA 2',3'-cyclic 3'-phosphodiesterase
VTPDAGVDPLRLFFALIPGAALQAELAALGRGVAQRAQGRAVAARNIHLTLAFLGDVPASGVPGLQSIAGQLPRDAFTLVLDRVGGFRGSGVAWLGARAVPGALAGLQRTLAEALRARGFRIEARPFAVHLTLARKCRVVLDEPLAGPVEWPVEAIALVASTLAPGGSVYRTLATWPLAPVAAPNAAGSPS